MVPFDGSVLGDIISSSLTYLYPFCDGFVLFTTFFLFFHATAKERVQREQFRDLTVFERLNGNPRKTSSTLAVKKVVNSY